MNSQNESVNDVVRCDSRYSEILTDKINAEIDKAFSGITTSSSYVTSCVAGENVSNVDSQESIPTMEQKCGNKKTSCTGLGDHDLQGTSHSSFSVQMPSLLVISTGAVLIGAIALLGYHFKYPFIYRRSIIMCYRRRDTKPVLNRPKVNPGPSKVSSQGSSPEAVQNRHKSKAHEIQASVFPKESAASPKKSNTTKSNRPSVSGPNICGTSKKHPDKKMPINAHSDYFVDKTQRDATLKNLSKKNLKADIGCINNPGSPITQSPSKHEGDLGAVNMVNMDISMRSLMKETKEVSMPLMSRKEWKNAADDLFEQYEKDLLTEHNLHMTTNDRHVQFDLEKSVVYVVPPEFTQESENTQSSQLPTESASVVPEVANGSTTNKNEYC
ncbi:hypothetical protein DdX_04439 [Ditylenchus destructor]|uniref:Uncharacterized protein n=1 Tax=Ditylenchus destructor TaxID=166010 RepID=A0AAD4NB40_9BILA|nr:hypothetical protein DdX_04439 [Ditylenchus destructor]